MVKTDTTKSSQYTYTLPLEGGRAVAQPQSLTDGQNGKKKPKSTARGRRMRQYSQSSYHNISPVYLHTAPLRGHSCCSAALLKQAEEGKKTKVHILREKDGVVQSKLILHQILSILTHSPFKGAQLLHSCTHKAAGRIGKKHQSPWLQREGWSSIVETYTTTSLQYTLTLPLEGGIAVAQLHSSSSRPNREKRPKSMA